VTGTITSVEDPDLGGFVGLPAAFAVRDLGHGAQATSSDLAADLHIIFADCVDPTVVQIMNPLTPLDAGNVAVTTHTPREK
jgi:predicted anti-sigma-YlaC factor YlaD